MGGLGQDAVINSKIFVDFFFKHVFLAHVLIPNVTCQYRFPASSPCEALGFIRQGKEALKGLTWAFKCFDCKVTPAPFLSPPIGRTSHMTLPDCDGVGTSHCLLAVRSWAARPWSTRASVSSRRNQS